MVKQALSPPGWLFVPSQEIVPRRPRLFLLVVVVVVDVLVPEDGLVAVAPRIVLGADVLVRVLGALLQGRHVRPVVPVLVPLDPGVDAGEDEGGRQGVDADLAPQLGGLSSVVLNGLTLLDEGILGLGVETALHGIAENGAALGSQPGNGAEDLAHICRR